MVNVALRSSRSQTGTWLRLNLSDKDHDRLATTRQLEIRRHGRSIAEDVLDLGPRPVESCVVDMQSMGSVLPVFAKHMQDTTGIDDGLHFFNPGKYQVGLDRPGLPGVAANRLADGRSTRRHLSPHKVHFAIPCGDCVKVPHLTACSGHRSWEVPRFAAIAGYAEHDSAGFRRR